jgi:hypothetical protein
MNMNASQARIIDPVLSNHAQGYKHVDRVGHILFPRVEVNARGGSIIEFGRESFRKYNARRAPGADTQLIQIGHEGKPFNLVQDALNSSVPREVYSDAKAVPGIDMGMRAVNTVMNSLTLALECEQADIATDINNYSANQKVALAGAGQWSDPASDPAQAIEDAKEAVRLVAGVDPNVMVVSKPVFKFLKNHPKIVERFKYTSADSITTKMLANLFDLEHIAVGKAVALSSPDEDADFDDVWGNMAILAYAPQQSRGYEEPSFGYTYTYKGHPFSEKPFWDNGKKSWIYGVTYERLPVLTGMSSGFLFSNVVAE